MIKDKGMQKLSFFVIALSVFLVKIIILKNMRGNKRSWNFAIVFGLCGIIGVPYEVKHF